MSQAVGADVQLAVGDRFTVIEEDSRKTGISRGCSEKRTLEVRSANLPRGEEAGTVIEAIMGRNAESHFEVTDASGIVVTSVIGHFLFSDLD
jgi:hypothetical protein